MAKFIIEGGKSLSGEVRIGGSKNAILALIAGCILTKKPVTLTNVPEISDVETMLAIAKGLGADCEWDRENRKITIAAHTITSTSPDQTLSPKLRGSVLFAGALLGRERRADLPVPGGDIIGARPLDTHFRLFESLGAVVVPGNTIQIDGSELHGSDLTLEESSVTATENAILAAVRAPGKTLIRLAATEPHVQELVRFLQKMGARIQWRDLSRIEIEGVTELGGCDHEVNPDEQEISSFAVLAACTHSTLLIRGIRQDYLDSVLLQLGKMGITHTLDRDTLTILPSLGKFRAFRIQAGLYPKLGSDHLPPFAVLATQSEGESLLHDWLYENRFRYIPELQKMGARCTILDPHRVRITGPTKLHGSEISSVDIRAGMTLVLAAMIAEGRSTILGVEHLDRGYETLTDRLQAIGADIRREE